MTHTAHSGSYDFGIGRKKVGWVLRRLRPWRFLSDVDIDCDRGCKTCSPQVDVERYCARATSSGGPCTRSDSYYGCAFSSSAVSRCDGSSVSASAWSIHYKRQHVHPMTSSQALVQRNARSSDRYSTSSVSRGRVGYNRQSGVGDSEDAGVIVIGAHFAVVESLVEGNGSCKNARNHSYDADNY